MSGLIQFSELQLLFPLIILLVASIIPITVKVLTNNHEQPPAATLAQGLIGIAAAAVLVFQQFGVERTYGFSSLLVFDGLSYLLNLSSLVVGAFVLLVGYRAATTGLNQLSEQVFLVLSSVVGMLILGWANDLMIVFVGMELMSLALYVLIGIGPEQKLTKEAAFKYFILGSFGSALFLYGVALIFGTTGSTSFLKLAELGPTLIGSSRIFGMGVIFLLAGLLFKVSVFPFHAWTPDVYQGAPTSVTLFMATAAKVAMFGIILRIVSLQGVIGTPELITVLQWFAVITMLVGNFAALRQATIKRMLAYSSIAHSGYLMAGVVAVAVSGDPSKTASSVFFYLVSYVIMSLGGFALVAMYEVDENRSVLVEDMKGLARKQPIRALAMMIVLLSLAGVPPTLGFMGKLYLFSAAVREGLVWLAAWGIGSSIIGVYYYLRPVVLMFMADPVEVDERSTWGTRVTLGFSALGVITFGIFASPLFEVIAASLRSMMNTP